MRPFSQPLPLGFLRPFFAFVPGPRFLLPAALLVSAASLPAAIGTWNGGWPPIAGSYNGTNDHNLPLSATVQESPPAITLLFHKTAGEYGYAVYRKLRDGASWGDPVATLPQGSASYVDTAVSAGVAYEYKIAVATSSPFGAPANYLVAGIRVDQTAPRGRLVLVVAETIASGLPDELAAYVRDLGAEGWTVHTVVAPAGDYSGAGNLHQPVRASIQALHATYPGEIKNIVLLGRVPVVRSGLRDLTRPDGHFDSYAEAVDSYYAEMDGNWTDTGTNAAYNPSKYGTQFLNVAGDGKYDASKVTDLGAGQKIEFGFGRIDFSENPGDELALTRLYLEKLARYRRASPDFQPGRRAVIRKGYDNVDETGWNALSSLVGPGNILAITNTADLPADPAGRLDADALFTRENQHGPLLFYFKGSGDLGRRDDGSRAVFWTGMQSHWGFWADSGRGQMTGRLASDDSYTLSFTWSIWALRYLYHRLGLGGDMGDVLRTTINNTSQSSGLYPYFSANMPWGDRNGRLWISHMGDPTLRLFPVRPPTHLTTAPSGPGGVALSWTPSSDTGLLGVHLYRAPGPAGPWTRLTAAGSPYSGNSYTDTPPSPGEWTYSVRAVKLETTACGTYLNPSIGATVTVDTAVSVQPLAITTPSLPVSTWQSSVNVKLKASGGNPPYVWSLAGGSLPEGLSLAPDGTISGSPVHGGVITQPVFQVIDFRGANATLAFELETSNRRVVSIPAEADTYAREGNGAAPENYKDFNYGIGSSFLVRKSSPETLAYLRFALPVLASGERIDAARLRLHLGDATLASSFTTTLTVSLLADSADAWVEGSLNGSAGTDTALTFANRPTALNSAAVPVTLLGDFAADRTVTLDVLPFAQETLVHDPARKLGLLLGINTTSELEIYSRENHPLFRPVIDLEITHAPLITLSRPAYDITRVSAGQGLALRSTVTDSSPVTHIWTQVSGPGAASFSSAAAPDTDVTFSEPGRYSLRLDSDDGTLISHRVVDVRVVPSGDTARTRNLVLHYRFDESSGATAADTSLDSVVHPGTLAPSATGTLQWAPAGGRFRGALQFTASNSYVSTPDEDTLDNTSRLSIALWVNPAASSLDNNARGIISKRSASNTRESYTLYQQSGRVYIRFSGNNSTLGTAQPVLKAGRWTHLAAVFDGTQTDTAHRVTLYVDGAPIALSGASPETDTVIPNYASPLWIGQMGGGSASYSFIGLLDDVRVYRDRALSSSDIVDLLAAEAPQLSVVTSDTTPDTGESFSLSATLTADALPLPADSAFLLWSQSAGFGSAVFTAPASLSTQATIGAAGPARLRLTADDGRVITFADTLVSVQATGPDYSVWTAAISWPPGADATATGDPDGDGGTNFFEYATGRDPLKPDGAGLPALGRTSDGGQLTLSFNRIADPALTYTVEASADLSAHSWTPVFESTGGQNIAGPVTLEDTQLIGSHVRRFLRLKITRSPGTVALSLPNGYIRQTALSESDTLIALPLVRPAVFNGRLASFTGNTLALEHANLAPSSLVYNAGMQRNTHYLQVLTGPAAGHYSTVLGNTADSVTTEFETDILALIQPGDRIAIRPYWTFGSLLPASDAGASYVASTSNFPGGRRTEVLTPNIQSTGINRSAGATYFFNEFWRKVGAVSADQSDTALLPDSYLTVRGNNYTADTSVLVSGEIPPAVQIVSLRTTPGFQNDNPVGLALPVDITLSALGLTGDGRPFKPSAGNFPSGRGDELLVFNNLLREKNKSPGATYFFNGFWRKVGAVGTDQNATTIPAGSALVIRRQGDVTPPTDDWKLTYSP